MQKITDTWMKNQITISNKQAAINRNLYPIQEQATQLDLWEYVPCTCDTSCTCKKYCCTHHWKLKDGVRFEDFTYGFLRIFVDKHQHWNVIEALNGNPRVALNSRAIGAFTVLKSLKPMWEKMATNSSRHNKTLFCDDWGNNFFKDLWSFSVRNSIYQAKQYCILLPDICIPYDAKSRELLIQQFSLRNPTYYSLLSSMRHAFIECMKENHMTIPSLRTLDTPQDQVPFNKYKISLPVRGRDYGIAYLPKERQISIVLDKCFYQPTTI